MDLQKPIHAPHEVKENQLLKGWAARKLRFRCLMNNLDPDVAEKTGRN